MKKRFLLVFCGVFLAAAGCDKPTQPSGAVDTSDPNKTYGTMAPLSKGGKDPNAPGGMPKTGQLPKSPGGQ